VRGGELSTSVFCRGEKRQQRVVYDVNDIDPITLRVASQCDTIRHIGITCPRTREPFEGRKPLEQRSFSIQKCALIRAIQRERRYLNIKTLTALTLHLVGPAHHPRRRVERRATRIFKDLSRLEDRLLPDDTRSFNLGQFATRIRDHPMPAQKMHRFPSLILDDHSISPKILRTVRR
jgi:hypothetical protein